MRLWRVGAPSALRGVEFGHIRTGDIRGGRLDFAATGRGPSGRPPGGSAKAGGISRWRYSTRARLIARIARELNERGWVSRSGAIGSFSGIGASCGRVQILQPKSLITRLGGQC